MELKRDQIIHADQQSVWNALNDDDVLKRSIPGCEVVERLDENTIKAVVKIKVGPVGARFTGMVRFSNQDAPNGYTLTFEGQGGAAGFAKGDASVSLKSQDDGTTVLSYEAHAQVGGRLAQIGSRLIDSVAAKTAADFFESFSRIVAGGPEAMTDSPLPLSAKSPASPERKILVSPPDPRVGTLPATGVDVATIAAAAAANAVAAVAAISEARLTLGAQSSAFVKVTLFLMTCCSLVTTGLVGWYVLHLAR